MTTTPKKVAWVLIAFVLVSAAAATTALLWLRSATQPQLDGTLTLPGLSAPVEIVRDAEGIPHITAQSQSDAHFALGFVHAQDRLWQLEMNRRVAAGRLAEILGPSALPTDRVLRTLGVRRNAERIYANLSVESRTALNAYSRGVNAYLVQRSGPLPPEFLLTRAPAPEPWQPADSLGWQTMMAWDLGGNWGQELLRMRLAQRWSLEEINQLLAPYPGEAPLATRDYTSLYRGLGASAEQLAAVKEAAPPSYVEGMGSNNWVVAGALSETGKPLLANDPHLSLGVPSLWYFAHLSAPGLKVIGATLPGLPNVVLGRTDRIAWGFTNTGPDVQDLFIERINPDNPREYLTPDGWKEFSQRVEVIKVKGAETVELLVRDTRHGPVISAAMPAVDKAALREGHVIAFSWTALRPDDKTFQAGIKLNRARDWDDFVEAMRDFGAPQQSVVYADVEGNIGFIAPARLPVRKPENDLKGLAPAPGWDARYDWAGFIPFEELPRAFNPVSQRIVTANQKIVGPDYPHFITSEWAPPYRFERINMLLDAKPRHTLESFAAMQADTVSLAARELLPLMTKVTPASSQGRRALALLRRWDGDVAAERPEPLIFNGWLRTLSRQMFAEKMGEALFRDYWDVRHVVPPLKGALLGKTGNQWCATSQGGAGQPDCSVLLVKSLEDALTDIGVTQGQDLSRWQWGKAHMAIAEHRPFSKVPLLADWFELRVPSPGDTYTVNVGRYTIRDETDPFANRHAASLRALYDLGDLENSRFIHSTGQSGNRLSPLYAHYLQRWVDVAYVPMRMERSAFEKNSLGTLRLVPQSR